MQTKVLSEVLKELESLGIKVDPRTIKNYSDKGLAPKQVKRGGGRGVEAQYPFDMAAEVAASYYLLNELMLSVAVAMKVYKVAKYVKESITYSHRGLKDDKKLRRLLGKDGLVAYLSGAWLSHMQLAKEKLYKTTDELNVKIREAMEKAKAEANTDEWPEPPAHVNEMIEEEFRLDWFRREASLDLLGVIYKDLGEDMLFWDLAVEEMDKDEKKRAMARHGIFSMIKETELECQIEHLKSELEILQDQLTLLRKYRRSAKKGGDKE